MQFEIYDNIYLFGRNYITTRIDESLNPSVFWMFGKPNVIYYYLPKNPLFSNFNF